MADPEEFTSVGDAIGVEPMVAVGLNLPLWLQNGSYGAVLDRSLIDSIMSPGIRVPSPGSTNPLQVTPRAAGANMSVDVAVGDCVIAGTNTAGQGSYLCRATAINNVPINGAPAAGTSRIDRIVARVYDTAVIGGSVNGWAIEVVAGTAAASPAVPALPASSLSLARVLVASGTASITAGLITDDRLWSMPGRGQIYVKEFDFPMAVDTAGSEITIASVVPPVDVVAISLDAIINISAAPGATSGQIRPFFSLSTGSTPAPFYYPTATTPSLAANNAYDSIPLKGRWGPVSAGTLVTVKLTIGVAGGQAIRISDVVGTMTLLPYGVFTWT